MPDRTDHSQPAELTVYSLFASTAGDPLHLRVVICPRCGALVALTHGTRHADYHRQLDAELAQR